jgi:hypothetical protein
MSTIIQVGSKISDFENYEPFETIITYFGRKYYLISKNDLLLFQHVIFKMIDCTTNKFEQLTIFVWKNEVTGIAVNDNVFLNIESVLFEKQKFILSIVN